jgi:toxin-antitoxin system PIN domain toxin
MAVVDTNVLLYAADEDSAGHLACFDLLRGLRQQTEPWHTSWPILNEFLRVATHSRVWKRPWTAGAAWKFVEAILASPGFSVLIPTPRHPEILGQILRETPNLQGNIFHDVHTAALMREHQVRTIYTHDVDFQRFPFLEVADPLASA